MSTLFTAAGHGFSADDPVVFGNCYPDPSPLVEGTVYYVLATDLDTDHFRVSDSVGGTAITLDAELDEFVVSLIYDGIYTEITDPDHVMAPPESPTVFNWTFTTAAVVQADGSVQSRLIATHIPPTAGFIEENYKGATTIHFIATTDSSEGALNFVGTLATSTGLDRAIVNGTPGDYQVLSLPAEPGVSYYGRIFLTDVYGNIGGGAWLGPVVAAGDTTAPAQVTGAAAYGAILGLIVGWTKSTAVDLAHYEIQVDDNSGFTSPDTYVNKGNVFALQAIAAGTYYFRIRAIDTSGNAGTYSATVSATSRTVQTADLTDALITTAKLVAGAVTDVELAANAVIAAKIATDAVTAAAIAAGAVGNSELATGAVTAAKITAGTITSNEIAALTIVAANIAAGTITAAKIAAGTITANEIAALTIVAANIAAGTITAAKIAAGTITANEIAALTIVAANIAASTITGAKIAAGTITASNIAADTITANEIAANAITSNELAAGAVIAGKIAAGTIVTGDLNATCSISLVSNSGATVVIDATGITITNGKLTLQDEWGASVIGASGFSGNWTEFILSGLYNGAFRSGVVGTIGTGRTSALPYWTVSNVAGTPTLTFVGPGIKCKWAAIDTTKMIVSDFITVLPGSSVEAAISLQYNRTSGGVHVEVEVETWDSTQTFAVGLIAIDETLTASTSGIVTFRAMAAIPTNAYYYKVKVRLTEKTTHNASNEVLVYQVAAKVATAPNFDVITYAGLFSAFPHTPVTGDLRFRSDVNMWFKYNGAQWVCTCPHTAQFVMIVTATLALAATTTARFLAPLPVNQGLDILVEGVECAFDVEGGGTALGASHKWVGTVLIMPTGTTIATLTIASGASGTWRSVADSTDTVVDITSAEVGLRLDWTKTGTPGALEVAPSVNYRFIAV